MTLRFLLLVAAIGQAVLLLSLGLFVLGKR